MVGINCPKPWEKCPGRRGLVLRLKPARHRDIMEIWAYWRRRLLWLSPFSLIMSPCSRFMNLFGRERKRSIHHFASPPGPFHHWSSYGALFAARGENEVDLRGPIRHIWCFERTICRHGLPIYVIWHSYSRKVWKLVSHVKMSEKEREKLFLGTKEYRLFYDLFRRIWAKKLTRPKRDSFAKRQSMKWAELTSQMCISREKRGKTGEFSLSCRLAFNPDDTW